MITFEIKRTLAEISSTGSTAKRLTLTSWSGNPAKLDLRVWRTNEDPPQPGRGVTLTDEEAEALSEALNDYLSGRAI